MEALLPIYDSNLWVNMNLRVAYDDYLLMNGWQGDDWYKVMPTFKVLFDISTNYSDISLYIMQTQSNLGCFIAEIKIFNLTETFSWG